jgi:hypothetical protein
MPGDSLTRWLDDFCGDDRFVYMKRLSGNDTGAVKSHVFGVYVPKKLAFRVAPALNDPNRKNPDCFLKGQVSSHGQERELRLIWYNNKTRDECRITGWGGKSSVRDPEKTSAITIFSFPKVTKGTPSECKVWVCDSQPEEQEVEDRFGEVWPGNVGGALEGGRIERLIPSDCTLSPDKIPPDWKVKMPKGEDLAIEAVRRKPLKKKSADDRLVPRLDCERELYESVEDAFYTPRIPSEFKNVNDLLKFAKPIAQGRMSRAGRSVELQVKAILEEEGLEQDVDFSYQAVTESTKPDFIFPSIESYRDDTFNESQLRMLAVKRTLRGRWPEVLPEAERVNRKHLLTLDPGCSENQFKRMTEANVILVVPKSQHEQFPKSVRPSLMTLAGFIDEVAGLRG